MNSPLFKHTRMALACAACLCAGTAAHAQNASAERWQFEASPYLWLAGVDGSIRVGDRSLDTSQSYDDILSDLDFGAMGTFEARKGRWAIFFDGVYTKVSDDAQSARGPVNGRLIQQIYSLGAAWRALEQGPTTVDVLGGLRYNYVKPRIEVAGTRTEEHKDALDPFIGIRGTYPVSPRWSLVGYADVGTISGGDVSWQLYAGANYAIDDSKTFKIGYRRLQGDYDTGDIDIDTTLQGVYVGVGFLF